jgi:hypothetical protein
MGSGQFKVDPTPIVQAHWATLRNARTGKPDRSDYFFFVALPSLLFGAFVVIDVTLGGPVTAALLTVFGLLGAFLFGVMLQIYSRASSLADLGPSPSVAVSRQAENLGELAANAGYAALVCIVTSVCYVVAIAASAWVTRVASALGLALGVHLTSVLLMVMRRLYFRTTDSLNETRTGAGHGTKSKRAA